MQVGLCRISSAATYLVVKGHVGMERNIQQQYSSAFFSIMSGSVLIYVHIIWGPHCPVLLFVMKLLLCPTAHAVQKIKRLALLTRHLETTRHYYDVTLAAAAAKTRSVDPS